MKKIILLVIGVLLIGCTNISKSPKDGITYSNYDRDIIVAKEPQKVLTLGPNCTELMIALGLEDKIVGTSLSNHSRGPLTEYQDVYATIPQLTYGPATREAVISSGADFIYGIDWEFGSEALDIEELESLGITVYQSKATTLEEIYQEIETLGKIFNVQEKATEIITRQKESLESIEEKVKTQEPMKVLVYDSGNDGIFTCGGTNFESLLIEKAGGINIFEDIKDKQWATVNYEEVLAREPDVIVIHDYDTPSKETKIAEIKSNPTLSQLSCVKEERFVYITLESVLPGNRIAYSVELLARGFNPALFK